MAILRKLLNSGVCVLTVCLATPLFAQTTIPDEIERANNFYTAGKYYGQIPGLFSSTNKCLSRGFSASVCDSARSMCAIQSFVGTVFDRVSVLMEVFQTDCGNGICFACCFTGAGCHTSFYSETYSPVLNCDRDYGPATRQAGPTLIVDPNAKPGDACLFIGQSCDHLPLCLSGKSPQEIERINNDPKHVMKSAPAVNSRARTFATTTLASWSRFLSDYHTSSETQSDDIHAKVHDFFELNSFITGRGCVGWGHGLPSSFPADWSDARFRVNDKDGNYADEASHYNGVRQLGLLRLLGTIPNLPGRLAYVESRIWTPDAIKQYLSSIGDPDVVFLRSMSPIALEILKQNRQLQDYRLLAVPLPSETPTPRRYDGCTLGDPPVVRLSSTTRGPLGIDLQVIATDSEKSAALPVETLVIWGDGSVTPLSIPAGGTAQNASHDYATGGKYQLLVSAQNDAGLRTIGGLIAQTAASGTNVANRPLPIISEVQLVDLRAVIESFAGNALPMLFELEGWTSASTGYALGISRALTVTLEAPARFGTIAGWNTGARPLQSVTIRPTRFGEGALIGFRRNYFTLDRVRIGIYSTQYRRLQYYDVPVTADMVRLYPEGSNTPVPLATPTYGADGRLEIPVQTQTPPARYSRVDLLLPNDVLIQAIQQPVTDAAWTGFTGSVSELIPGQRDESTARRRAAGH